MTGIAKVTVGSIVTLDGDKQFLVCRFESPTVVVIRDLETNLIQSVPLEHIRCSTKATKRGGADLDAISPKRFESAQARYMIIKPLIDAGCWNTEEVEKAATAAGVARSTVYRWLKEFRNGSLVSNLMRKQRDDTGTTRLPEAVEAIINDVIADYWLTPERRSATNAHREVRRRCWGANPRLKPPSLTTFLHRLEQLDSKNVAKKREGKAASDKLELNKGTVPFADRPYGILQIDHTLVDIHLVDEVHRVWIGRPWITVAIDVYSRMVAGYYVSFDPPGTLATGICLANAMLSKKSMLARLGLTYSYPCMGKPHVVHLDNAKEFHGKTLERACNEYGIDLLFRKLKTPRYGAHIERYMGTLMHEIQALPGTSFSNVEQRGEYDSQGRASMTLKEFELWLANLILGYYHQQPHAVLGRSPLGHYTKGILGDGTSFGAGVIEVLTDEERLRIDFLPMFEPTVQSYGIKIDHISYQSDALRRWVGSMDPKKKRERRKFICRRDPRDISYILFFDPDVQTYFRVPYRDLSHPPISLWELRAVRAHLRDQGRNEVDEATIFKALDEMHRIQNAAVKETAKAKRSEGMKRALRRRDSPQPTVPVSTQAVPANEEQAISSPSDIEPFDEVEWL